MLFDIIFFGSAILIVLVTYYFFSYRKTGSSSSQQGVNQQHQVANQQAQQQQQNQENEEEEKMEAKTSKQLQKEAKKQEKQQQRQALLQQIEQKQKKKDQQSKKYEEAQQQREEKEKREQEELDKLIEEQKQKEQEIYNQWKSQFSVEEKGISLDEDNKQSLLQSFLKYIKLRKVVKLEDLAGEFKLSISDIIERIKSFEISGDLFGVFDERGKYIYITMEEMHALKNYISMKGRVSRSELILECNNIIRLNPSGKDLKQISEEEKAMLKDVEKEFESIKQEMQEVK